MPSPVALADPGSAAYRLSSLQDTVGSADWSRWTNNRFVFYDYVDYPTAGTTEIQFFAQPMGSTDTYNSSKVKTLEQCNFPESRSFGRVGFRMRQIRTHIRVKPKARQVSAISTATNAITSGYGALMEKLFNLSLQGVLLINIGQKEFWDIGQPFLTCPPGFGPTILDFGGQKTNASSNSQALWYQQDPCSKSVYSVDPEQLIEAGQTFSARIVFDNAASPALTNIYPNTSGGATPQVEIGLMFEGYILRPMQ